MKHRITRIHVKGFRSIREVELAPGPITVLIGPNGAGKSNLLAFLKLVSLARTQSLQRFIGTSGRASGLLHYGPSVTREVEFRLDFQDEKDRQNSYFARLGYAAGDTLIFLDEAVEFRTPGFPKPKHHSLGAGHAESRLPEDKTDETALVVNSLVAKMNFFHFHDTSLTSALRAASRKVDDRFLRSDGSNLAAFLYRLATADDAGFKASFNRITATLRRIAPFIKRLEPELSDAANPEKATVLLRWVDEGDHRFGAHDLSDGTLRAVALVTALLQPPATLPMFITIDEPELGLHPAALSLLASIIRSVSTHAQVLVATQSSSLLDHFEPEEVVVAERAEGATQLRRLDVPALQQWREKYSLSELYDKNVLGGRP